MQAPLSDRGRPRRTAPSRLRARARRAAAPLLAAVPLAACYASTPLATPEPSPGIRIVAELTPEASVDLASRIGAGAVSVEAVTGEVENGDWELYVIRVADASGHSVPWNRERLVLHRSALASVQARRLSRTRTALATVGTIAAAVLLGRTFGEGGVIGGTGGRGPGTSPVH